MMHELARWIQRSMTGNSCAALLLLCPFLASAQDSVLTLNPGDGTPGYVNGPLASARFNDPAGLVFDSSGNLFVADSRNHVIRKVSPDGTVSLLAGRVGEAGFANGNGGAARFDTPFGVTVMPDGSLLVADTGNHVLRRVDGTGAVTSYAGLAGTPGNTNGPLAEARFHSPLGLKRDQQGNIWVADSGSHTIRRISPGGLVTTAAGVADMWGWQDGPAHGAKFHGPVDIAISADGKVFISDGFNHVIRCLDTNGAVVTVAGRPRIADKLDGSGSDARFWNPAGLAFDSAGNLYVADSRNHALRKISHDGQVTTISGLGGVPGRSDGANKSGRFFNPYALAFDPAGHLMVSDSYNQCLRQVFVPFTVFVAEGGSGRAIHWTAVVGRFYRVQYRTSFGEGEWLNLHSSLEATRQDMSISDSATGAQRFYRVVALEP